MDNILHTILSFHTKDKTIFCDLNRKETRRPMLCQFRLLAVSFGSYSEHEEKNNAPTTIRKQHRQPFLEELCIFQIIFKQRHRFG